MRFRHWSKTPAYAVLVGHLASLQDGFRGNCHSAAIPYCFQRLKLGR
jgi:hypothetical protein